MRRGVAQYLVGSVVLFALAGCGAIVFERRAAWRDEAEQACLASKVVKVSQYVEAGHEISGPGACGMLQPFKITAVADGTVGLTSKAVLACPMASRIDEWVTAVVQPAAELYFGQPVALLRAGSYSCRSMNNQPGAPRSEHSYGNAVDIMGFKLADGRDISVEKGWRGAPQEQDFLREVFVGSCRHFTTVLGPGADVFHYNHVHLDLARHGNRRVICKPVIKFAPRLDAMAAAGGALTPRPSLSSSLSGGFGMPAPAPRPSPSGPAQAGMPPRPTGATGRPLSLNFPDAGAWTPAEIEMDDPVEMITPENDPFAVTPRAPVGGRRVP